MISSLHSGWEKYTDADCVIMRLIQENHGELFSSVCFHGRVEKHLMRVARRRVD